MDETTPNTGNNFWLDQDRQQPTIKDRPQVDHGLWLLAEFLPDLTADSAERIADSLIRYVGWMDAKTTEMDTTANSQTLTQDVYKATAEISLAIAEQFELTPAIADGIIDSLKGYKAFCGEDGGDRFYNPDTTQAEDQTVGKISGMIAEFYGDVLCPAVADGLIEELNEYKQNEKD